MQQKVQESQSVRRAHGALPQIQTSLVRVRRLRKIIIKFKIVQETQKEAPDEKLPVPP